LLEHGILNRSKDVFVNGHPENRLPGTLNMSFAGIEGETLLMALDLEGIAVSLGSACTAGSTDPSHVLLAMGRSTPDALSSIRFSVGPTNTEQEMKQTINVLTLAVERLRGFEAKSYGEKSYGEK